MSNIVVVEIASDENILTAEENFVLVEVINTEKILTSDLPDNIPVTKIKKTGTDGLEYYLDNYDYKIDCGTP
jgi:hypothetical protein